MDQPAAEEKVPQEELANDPHRPQYHFLSPANWMNDPNGLIQWRGQYHLFYQYNPNGPFHGTIHWGHAVSEDLVHWTHLPIALAPTPGGLDKDGCWSGCAVDDHGTPTLVYTAVHPEVQCIATSQDDLLTWNKHPGNPIIATPPPDLAVTGFRDPWVWRENNTWYLLLGSGIRDIGGAALLYKSRDLVHWDYVHPILVGDKNETGEMWECPGLFPLGDKHVLLVSIQPEFRHTYYSIGTYADHKFTPEDWGKIDSGEYFYAAQTLLDDQGRRLMWGWLKEGRSEEAQRAGGWAGVMSLPRILSIRPDGSLGVEPAPELKALRGEHHHVTDFDVPPASTKILEDARGDCLEIIAEFEPSDATAFGVRVRCSSDRTEQTSVLYDGAAERLVVDRQRSSLDSETDQGACGTSFELVTGEMLKLYIFLDRSVLEVYANGRACITSRIYPSRADSLDVGLFARGDRVRLKSLDIWEMDSIWASKG